MSLRPAILVVSDTASQDPSTDRSGPALKEAFTPEKWKEPVVSVVADDVMAVQRAVCGWADGSGGDDGVNLIVTTGGTGFARRDFTPEAIAPLLHRHAPGLVHAMLAASFQITPFAMMSRPVAGVRNKTLIITLPGSPKGAKENLEAVLKFLPHACMQAAGQDSRQAHAGGVKQLEKDAGHSSTAKGASAVTGSAAASHDHAHHHHHDHDHGHGHKVPKPHTNPSDRPHQSNDPRLGASHRARSSPYPMLTVAQAISKILQVAPAPTPTKQPLTPSLVGAVLAEDIHARESVPAYRASIVDGYAIIVPDDRASPDAGKGIKGTFPVASVSHAQASSLPPPLRAGEIARITTGAPLPDNANAVVMVEDTAVASTTDADGDDGEEEKEVTILTNAVEIGENVREPGSDIPLHALVLRQGQRIGRLGGEIGVLAASGTRDVPVYRRPRLGVMSTGDEVTDNAHEGLLSAGMIRDSNRPSLLSLVRGWDLCEAVVDLGVARDTPHGQLEEKLRDALRSHDLDVVVTTGGVSMGELDLLKPTVERALGGTVHFGRVSMKPGKPTTFASVPFKRAKDDGGAKRQERLIFGLPGNPASAIVTAHLFLLPCLQRMAGLEGKGLERVRVAVGDERIRCDGVRVEYHRVVVRADADGRLVGTSTGMQRSSRVGSLAGANALLELPLQEGFVVKGETCEALMMGPLLGVS